LETPYLQRIFWAVTEASCATALIMIGGTDALVAVQALSLALGLRERERERERFMSHFSSQKY
jgi:choline-glycine betaine transporter